ncbi:phage tail protein [Endozoicomonas sp. ONNA1]|uniref:phage tail protein n=1 Tax=Endozoicomonas sp. ONNA1 TaxID=2828740 RepID=UPI002147860F|nr:phage tail protein [Endozoicomonas sp. ONNA1]
MSTADDYYLDNQPGATFRAELNTILAAVQSANSGSVEPTDKVPGMVWFETDTNKRWRRNANNDAWVMIYDQSNKPTKGDVGLGSVANYGNTSSVTDPSTSKYLLAAAAKNLNDNKLGKTEKAADSSKLNGQAASYYATATHSHTPSSIGAADRQHTHPEGDLPNASTSAQGVVQLSNSTGGSSETKAATEKAVKDAKNQAIAAGVPAGAIIMWAGTEAQIPSGWQLANGQGNTSNGIKIPNLQDRFIVGAGSAYAVGNNGGSVSKTTGAAGSHSHTVSVGNTTLSTSQMPSHKHRLKLRASGDNGGSLSDGAVRTQFHHSSQQIKLMHSDNTADYEGGSGSHNHSGSSGSSGSHSHTVDVRPPYYALCYIVKL